MRPTRRDTLKLAGLTMIGLGVDPAKAEDVLNTKTPPRMPLDEFVKDEQLMHAFLRGVRAMKARKPSDPLSWFYQAAIHGVPADMIQVAAKEDPKVNDVDQKKYWNQCPHFGQASANFLPWHRGYTYYFERILRAHTNEPRFALPYWEYTNSSKPDNLKFPREFGIDKLDKPLDNDDKNPLHHEDRNTYFTSWTHWSGNNLPYSQLTPEAVDWAPARDAQTFFGLTERDGLGGAVEDEDPFSRGRLESFPHDPIHRVTGIVVPDQTVPDPNNAGQVIIKPGFALGMSAPPTAGFDPIFCVHHSNMDRLWALWALMPGKSWGPMPPRQWFEDKPWTFFDVQMKNGAMEAVEVSKERKAYFDSRSMGIIFKDEDLTKKPLTLPDPIPKDPKGGKHPELKVIAKVPEAITVMGLRPERVATASAAKELNEPFARAKAAPAAGMGLTSRILMRLNEVDMGSSNATGFDIHLVADPSAKPKRSDPSFVGSIALFRHEHAGGHGHKKGVTKKPSELFDVTMAVRATGQADPTKMHVVIIPYSLTQELDGKSKIVERRTLQFGSIEFLTE